MKVRFVWLCLLLLTMMGCKDKQSELICIVTTPDIDYGQLLEPDMKVCIHIESESQSSVVSHILLTEWDDVDGERMVLDTMFAYPSAKVSMDYVYTTHHYYYDASQPKDTMRVQIRARAYAANGESMGYKMSLYVKAEPKDEKQLESHDAITLYSAASGDKSAFNLRTLSTFFPDTIKKDEYCFYDELLPDSSLSRIWYSNSGIMFANFENFKFDDATATSVINAYTASEHYTRIEDIKNDDIILVGTKSNALGVIKVLLLSDEEGTANDRYVFTIKVIK